MTNQPTDQPIPDEGACRYPASPAEMRLLADSAAVQAARQEAGGLSDTDLAGEIAMLRVTLQRVFSIASQAAADGSEGVALPEPPKPRKGRKRAEVAGQMPMGQVDGRGPVVRLPLADMHIPSTPQPAPTAESLDLWIRVLEKLGQGATRLANLMRTQQELQGSQLNQLGAELQQTLEALSQDIANVKEALDDGG